MKNLLIFCFCSLYTLVLLAQNRITTDTAGMLHMGAGNITLLELDTIYRSERSPVVIRRDTTAFEMIYIDSLLPAPVGKPQVLSASLSAGRTEAILDVSASGGATYTVPFALPPGINGVMPQLGLAYNSQGGNGIAGYGWNIYGLSSITRVGSAMYTNDRVGGVNLDTADRFALDGQRLLLKSGIYGTDGAEYQTEQYSNVRIISRGVSPYGSEYGPEYFEVHHPDGSKAFYGQTTGSRSRDQYALTYIENPQGVRISYTYNVYDNQLYIASVRYGSRGTDPAINEVIFSYAVRSRAEQYYIGGESFYSNRRISKITVMANGIPNRHYVPSYGTITTLSYDRMSQIQEIDGTENYAFEPIYFIYDDTNNLVTTQTISDLNPSGIGSNNSSVVTADFTGSGSMDFLLYPTSKNKFYAFYNLDPGNPYMQLGYEVNTGAFRNIFPTTWLTDNDKVLPGQGMMLVKNNGTNKYKFDVYAAGTVVPVYFQYSKLWNDPPLYPGYYSECDMQYYEGDQRYFEFVSGDFNGDGLTDLIAISRNQRILVAEYLEYPSYECIQEWGDTGSIAFFIDMDPRNTTNYISSESYIVPYFNVGDKLFTADFDGDGKTDILLVKNGSMAVYSLGEYNYLRRKWSTTDTRITNDNTKPMLLGDYNGDGKMDVMFSTGYNNLFATFMSTGAGFVKHEQNQPFSNVENTWNSSTGTMQQYVLLPSDVNGDGKTDMIYARTTTYNSTATGSIYTVVHHNTGVNSSYAPVFGVSASTTTTTNVRHYPIPLFLNPDRQNPDLEFGFVSDNTITLFKSHKNMQREALLTTIGQDGVTYEVEYARLMPDDYYVYDIPLYQSSDDQTYPYIDIHYAPGTRIVPRVTRTAMGQTLQQVFGYREAVSNAEGLGFVGFRELIRSNWHVDMLDSNRTFTIGVQSPQLRGANLRTFTSKWSYITDSIRNMALTVPPPIGGVPDGATLQWDYINRQDVAYYTDTLANRTFVNIPIATSTKDLLSGTYHNRQMKYDNLYNMTYLAEDINNEASKQTGMTYANSTGASYYVGRLLSQQDTMMLATDTTTAETQYTYTDYLPTEVKRKGHGTDFVVDSLSYDIFGNVTERKTTVPGGAQRTEMMQYDASGRFMTQHMDPDSLVTTYSYYPDIGQVHTETDPYSRSTTYSYDDWGRLGSWTDYLGNQGTRTYSRIGGGLVQLYEGLPTGEESWTDINVLGHKVEVIEKMVLDVSIGRAWMYDIYGRVISESLPARDNSYDQWNNIRYDRYGRVNREAHYTGKVSNYIYTGLTTVVNDGAKTVTSTRNALGQIVSVQDPGGTVTYSYYANGNLKETDYGGSIQAIEQDGWGRKTKLTDPSAGVYTYSYDGWGQITQETTPKGSTTYGYDSVGKLLSKSLTGDSTDMQWTYSYDPVYRLPVQTVLLNADGNNSTYSYTYDGWSRPDSVIEDNIHAIFTKSYTYNNTGLVDTVLIKAKEKVTGRQAMQGWRNHYSAGELERITLLGSDEVIWRVGFIDQVGMVSEVYQGNHQMTSFQYDAFNYPQQRKLERTSGPPTTLMTLGTTFNAPRGFPTSRSNSVFGWNESFGYDNMDRLTTFDDNNGSHSQQYDARGRITENSLLGEYSYLGNSYQQHELELNPTADLYYQSRSPQQISFNAFKKPVEIHETGHDRVSFQYNGALQRSHNYYGSEAIDPLDRPYRRHYSQDGSVEITRDMLTDTTSFVFYLGGDAYSAPAIWKVEQNSISSNSQLYYLHRDYLGSILLITDSIGGIVEQRQFDAWGNIVKLTDGSSNPLDKFVILDRGYTGHEHLFGVALINMNGRLYDARLHRFLSPDNYVQDALNTQNFNRYGYAMNNPLVYVDQNGEFLWFVPIIVGAVVGAYLGGSAANNNFNPFKWDYGSWSTWRGMATGAVIGGISGASWSFGLAALNGSALVGGHTVVSGLSVSGLTKVAAWTVLGSKAISTATTVASMISDFDNAARIWAGKYYSDDNISFGGQLMQGLSRSTWEILQSWGGYNYSQIRNIAGDVDRVDYLGGATFVTNEGAAGGAWGVSLGNYLNLNINGGIIGSFSEWVTNNPLYMHEYGHTFDSRGYGPAYLFKVGIPSARSAKRSTQISGEPQGVETHDFQWYEMNANRYAARYFGRYYGVNWNRPFGLPGDTIETYYPRRTRIRTRR